jgi:hypothetical protein
MNHLAALAAASLATALSPAAAQVERASFDQSPFALGTLTESDGALSRDLWAGSEAEAVGEQLRNLPTRFDDPVKRMILRRVLLSPGEAPEGADSQLAGLKLLKASEAGYAMEAGGLAELSPGLSTRPSLSRIAAIRDLYRGRIDPACQRGASLREGRQDPFFVRLRAFCYIHTGERAAADLTISLAREEGALSASDERMFSALLAGRPIAEYPESGLQYAAYRKNAGVFAPGDIERLAPSVAAAVVLDEGIAIPAREQALYRAARESLLGDRDLGDAAVNLTGTAAAEEIGRIRGYPEGFSEREVAIGEALLAARSNPDLFLLYTKVFSSEIASLMPQEQTAPFAAEIALASLLNRRFEAAERWMQQLATEQTIGAERAFLNLAKLYGYLRPGAAQRLAGAVGAEISGPKVGEIQIYDPLAARSEDIELAEETSRALRAARSGSRAAMLLSALTSGAIEAEGEAAAIRDRIGSTLYSEANASEFLREAAFTRDALAAVASLRESAIDDEAYVPRLKPGQGR